MKPKMILLTLSCLLLITLVPAATSAIAQDTTEFRLTLEDAVKLGLENSVVLEQVKNQISLSEVADDRSNYLRKKMDDGKDAIENGREQLSQAQNQIDTAQNQLDQAKDLVAQGRAPQDITLNGTTIPAGTELNAVLGEEAAAAVIAGIESDIQSQQEILNQNKDLLEQNQQKLLDGQASLDASLSEAGSVLSEKLQIDDLGALGVESTGNLMTTISGVSYQITQASYDIYKNQIALLIQKSYLDLLKAQKMLETKKKAVDRAEKQYNFAKESFEVGMKARDDMLLANVYYKGTQIEYQKVQGELNNAVIQLNKNLSIPLDSKIVLTDVFAEEVSEQNLADGISSGLKNRLEIKKAAGEVLVYDLNFDTVKRKFPSNTFQYKEAELLKQKTHLNYDKTKTDVESSIRQSYETLVSTGNMLNTSKEMVEQARESVEIAEYKYQEGFGIESSLLKKLNLESSAGTILEVLAAQENLAQIEEKVVEITYGYNLAKMKYYNDIGKFIY